MDLEELVGAVERRRQQGARNVNLLGGEPTASLPGVLTLLARDSDAHAGCSELQYVLQ